MKILVTGGAGFIGSHIVDAYIEAGHDVVVVDDLSSGSERNVNTKAKFYLADICDAAAIARIMETEKPEVLNHHAALISVTGGTDPRVMEEVNVQGTLNLLQHMHPGGRMIFPSSAAVYGDARELPVREDAPLKPISPYGTSKLHAEEAVRAHAATGGYSYVILRYANVYGPRQHRTKGGVVAVVQHIIASGGTPVIYGDGGKTRDYIYVEDVARANLAALAQGTNEVLNIATGKETADRDMFAHIMHAMHASGEPHYKPARAEEILRSALDPHRAREVLHWNAEVSVEEGVEKTISSAS